MQGVYSRAVQWVPDHGRGLIASVLAWALAVLMIVPENFDYAALATTHAPESGGWLSRMAWLLLLSGGAGMVIWRLPLAWLLLRRLNPFLLLFAFVAMASAIWSDDPAVTVRRCVRLLTILLVSMALVLAGWHAHRFQELLRPIITFMLAGSLVFGLAMPSLAIHQELSAELAGAWRGLANHKNTLGALAGIGLILWVHAWLTGEAGSRKVMMGCAVALACLLLSRSSTALMTTMFALGLLGLMQKAPLGLRPYLPYLIAAFVLTLVVYALAVLRLLPGSDILLSPIFMLTGKDPTFTGRAEIWEIINEHIQAQPWIGSGYGAYWTGPRADSPSYEFILRMQFYPGSAHNGYLEILNDLGTVGLLCLLGYLGVYILQSMRLLRQVPQLASLYLALFLQQAITNLSESHWLSVLSAGFVIMTFATAALARLAVDGELHRRFGMPVMPDHDSVAGITRA